MSLAFRPFVPDLEGLDAKEDQEEGSCNVIKGQGGGGKELIYLMQSLPQHNLHQALQQVAL